MAIITIDVDLTIVATDQLWFEYLEKVGIACSPLNRENLRDNSQPTGTCSYNLLEHFHIPKDGSGFDFWLQDALYQQQANLKDYVYKGCVDVIERLYKEGHDIVFASYCQVEHEKSKIQFLKDTFPFIYPEDFHFISTKSKGFVKSDILIDDRNLHHQQMSVSQPNCVCIRPKTQYTQECRGSHVDYTARDWYEIQVHIYRNL